MYPIVGAPPGMNKYGHAYNHNSEQDQVYMGALILNEKIVRFGSIYNGLLHYNGGDYWYPGATDSYAARFWPTNMQIPFTLSIRAMAADTKA